MSNYDYQPIRDRAFAVRRSVEPSSLGGASLGDFIRYFHCRLGFLRRFVDDDRVMELFREWSSYDQLGDKARSVATTTQRLAETLGVSRQEVLEGLHDGRLVIEVAPRLVRDFHAESLELLETRDALLVGGQLSDSARSFVTKLDLEWNWLVEELIDGFLGTLDAYLRGGGLTTTLTLTHEEPGTPAEVSLSFAPIAGETATAARARLREAYRKADSTLAGASAGRGRIPDKTRKTFEQYGEWLYVGAVQGKSIKAMARELIGGDHPEDRTSHVRYGMRRARQLLTLGDLFVPEE